MRKLNKNKGITLISLVITIIVMLILVGVSISMAVNGGLFNYAGKAVGETNKAITAENDIGNGEVTVDGMSFTSIDYYIEETKKEPDKLAGTWEFNDVLDIPISMYGAWSNLNFSSNSEQFTTLGTRASGGRIIYLCYVRTGTTIGAYDARTSTWEDDAYKKITITTEYDESLHADLLKFLNTYATKKD